MSYFNQLPLEELENTVENHPDEPEVRAALIKRLAVEEEFDEAIAQAFIATELLPYDSELQVLKAFCLLNAGEFERGHELLQTVLRNDPRIELQAQISTEIAPIFTPDAGGWTSAEMLQLQFPQGELTGGFGERFESMLNIVCVIADDPYEAVEQLNQHIQRFPSDLSARLYLASMHVANANEELAIPVYRDIIADDPECTSAYFDLATIVNSEEAVALTRKGLDLCPGHVAGRFNLGLFLLHAGRLEEGRAELTRIPADSQYYSNCLWAITESYERQSDFVNAIEASKRLCTLHPHDPNAHSNLGHLLCQSGQYDAAIVALEKAIEINPYHLDSLFNQAVAFMCAGRTEEAIARYEQRNEIEPNDPVALNNLATLYSKSGRLPEAIEVLERAHQIDPENELVCQNLGVFYSINSEFQRSLEFSSKAISLNPMNAKAHWNLACAFAKNGERELMLESLRTSLKISPELRPNLLSDGDLADYWDDDELIELAKFE